MEIGFDKIGFYFTALRVGGEKDFLAAADPVVANRVLGKGKVLFPGIDELFWPAGVKGAGIG